MESFEVPSWVLIAGIVILLLVSAYFASTETAMMKLNVYRMRALVRRRHGGARRAYKLLQHKDRLLGVILIGNNLVNFSAAVVANVLFVRWFGTEIGGVVTTVSMTMLFLIFAEIAPKTIAAVRPESIAYPSAYILVPLHSIMKYLVTFINFCGAFVVKPFTRGIEDDDGDLSEEELRQVFDQARKLPRNRQAMILNILNLEEQTVGDVMQPREAIDGIDLNDDMNEIRQRIADSKHTRLPVYRDSINDIEGVLHMREANKLVRDPESDKEALLASLENTYYTPNSVPLSRLVHNFKQQRRRFSIVVDEYGVVMGLITIDDIIEEIVGEFTDGDSDGAGGISQISEHTFEVTGNTLLHELNHAAKWTLPEDGPRTVNGWLLEHLRRVPAGRTTVPMDNYRVEIHDIVDNAITAATITHLPIEDDFGVAAPRQPANGETT